MKINWGRTLWRLYEDDADEDGLTPPSETVPATHSIRFDGTIVLRNGRGAKTTYGWLELPRLTVGEFLKRAEITAPEFVG